MRRKVIAGNWKMNKTNAEGVATINELKNLISNYKNVDVVIGAPSIMLADLAKAAAGSNVKIAAQNIYPKDSGAFTGEISAPMLKAIGVEYVILGHSERREYFNESDDFINQKVKAALACGLIPILCIGEKLGERESGKTKEVNTRQVKGGLAGISADDAKKIIVAYEPVWAIGTGKTATPEMAEETHKEIRDCLAELFGKEISEKIVIQYGGSMNAANAAELLKQPDIDGGLVGGASLDAKVFEVIVKAGN
ncbi:MAG: triose-phosphate isomerase [Fusobacteriaceae bacterium]